MLVVSRRKGEKIVIGNGKDAITISVILIVNQNKVRIGIDAPRDVIVDRLEIRQAKEKGDRDDSPTTEGES